jgi:hypothetical protein
MEKLVPFQAHSAWTDWVDHDLIRSRGAPGSDPFGVAPTLNWLRKEASTRGCDIDMQAKNELLRRRTGNIVLFDPVY